MRVEYFMRLTKTYDGNMKMYRIIEMTAGASLEHVSMQRSKFEMSRPDRGFLQNESHHQVRLQWTSIPVGD